MTSTRSLHSERTFLIPNGRRNVTDLHRLRYHLAVEGCPASQLSLAKSFLRESTECEAERKENAELAIHWLLLASSEGHEESLHLLKSCYEMGVGLTLQNRSQIETCLRSTAKEKLALHIGYSLFRLIAYNTEESIPLVYFQRRITLYLSDEHVSSENCHLFCSQDLTEVSVSVTVKDVVLSVHQCLLGCSPEIQLDDYRQHINPVTQQDHSLKKVIYLLLSFIYTYTHIFHEAREHFLMEFSKVQLTLPVAMVLVMFSLIAVLLIPNLYFVQYGKDILIYISHSLLYVSLFIMGVSSTKMIRCDKNRRNIDKWAQIIGKFDKAASSTIPQGHLHILLWFFLFLIGSIIFEMQNEPNLNYKYITFCNGMVLIPLTSISLNEIKSHSLSRLFLVLNIVLAMARLNVYKEINIITQALFMPAVDVPLSFPFQLTFGPATLLSTFAIILYFYIFTRYRLLSSLLCLVNIILLNVAVQILINSNDSVVYSLTFCLVLIIVQKKTGLCTMFCVAIFVVEINSGSRIAVAVTYTIIFLIIIKSLSWVKIYLTDKFRSASFNVYSTVFVSILVLLSMHLFTTLPFSSVHHIGNKMVDSIAWVDYAQQCHRQAWSKSNTAQAQIECDQLQGYPLAFEANVVSVLRIYSHTLRVPEVFKLVVETGHGISVNMYEINLHIKGTFSIEAELAVQIDDRCREFVFDLREGDLLDVVGVLHQGLGTAKPVLKLEQAHCLSCLDTVQCHLDTFVWTEVLQPKLLKVMRFFLYSWIRPKS